jgi:hypothetical protein
MAERIEEAKALLLPAIRPLFRADHEGNPFFVGSGVLVSVGRHRLLVSAAHVFDALQSGIFLMEGPSGDSPLVNGPTCSAAPGGIRRNDRYDVGFVQLTEKEAAGLSNPVFISCHHWQLNNIRTKKSVFLFMGYPDRDVIWNHSRMTVQTKPYPYWSLEASQVAYNRYKKFDVGPDTHLLVRFNHKQVRDHKRATRTPPVLNGTSGGGVWRVSNPLEPFRADSLPMLVGIFTAYNQTVFPTLRATRIGALSELIRRNLPDSGDVPRNFEVNEYPRL